MTKNVFTSAADDATKVIEFYEAQQRITSEFIEDMKRMHVYLLGIGRMGLSTHEQQQMQQILALDCVNERIMQYLVKHFDAISTEGFVTGQFAKSMFEVHSHVKKNGWPVGRNQANGE